MMKNPSKLTSAILLVLALTSCGGEKGDTPSPPTPPTPDDPDRMEIRISATPKSTKATDYGFEANDRVGIYVVNYSDKTPGILQVSGNHVDNMCFTYSGTWTPQTPVYWKDDVTHADFYLYHPYTTVNSVEAMPFVVNADQSTPEAFKASDLLLGKTLDVSPTSEAVVINASHVMSQIIIKLEAGNGFTTESIASSDVKVTINGIKNHSTVNIASQEVTPTGDAISLKPLYSEGTYKAIVVPQSVSEGNLITVNIDGKDFKFSKAFEFITGKLHTFTVTLSKTSEGINVNINPWSDGGEDNGGTAE